MMKRFHTSSKIYFVVILTFLSGVLACKKDTDIENLHREGELLINVNALSNGNNVHLDEEFTFPNGEPFKVTSLKFYLSNLRAINNQGQEIPLDLGNLPGSEEGVFLYQMGKTETLKSILPKGEYTQLKFDLGLAPNLNDLDPNQFLPNHPLSRDTDMFWDMLKYRFVIFEGGLDKDRNGTFDFPFSYHLGGDEFLRSVSLDRSFTIEENQVAEILLELNLSTFFTDGKDEIDILNFFSYHSLEEHKDKGLLLMDFIAKSFE